MTNRFFVRCACVSVRDITRTRLFRITFISGLGLFLAWLPLLGVGMQENHGLWPLPLSALVSTAGTIGGLVIFLVSAATASDLWSREMAQITYILQPRRAVVAFERLAAVMVLALGVVLAVFVGSVVGAEIVHGLFGVAISTQMSVSSALANSLAILFSALQGIAFGLLLRNLVASAVVYFLIPIGMAVVLANGASVASIEWLDYNGAFVVLQNGGGAMLEWFHLAAALGFWGVLPLAIGVILRSRADV